MKRRFSPMVKSLTTAAMHANPKAYHPLKLVPDEPKTGKIIPINQKK